MPLEDKKLRLEDAINATKAAVDEGIVPGGGAALSGSPGEAWPFSSAEVPFGQGSGDVVL